MFYEAKQSSGEKEGVTLVHQIRLKRGQFEATYKGAEEQGGKKTVAVMIPPKQKRLVK